MAIKRLLQRDIYPEYKRQSILKELFQEVYSVEVDEFFKNFYLSKDELLIMYNSGMRFGSHGLTHSWLETMQYKEQYIEVSKSFELLKSFGVLNKKDLLYMCYPYGSFNEDTIKVLKELEVDYGLSTDISSSMVSGEQTVYNLGRWNTNDWWSEEKKSPEKPSNLNLKLD